MDISEYWVPIGKQLNVDKYNLITSAYIGAAHVVEAPRRVECSENMGGKSCSSRHVSPAQTHW